MPVSARVLNDLEFLTAEREALFIILTGIHDTAKKLTQDNYHAFDGQMERVRRLEGEFMGIRRQLMKCNIQVPEEHKRERVPIEAVQKSVDDIINAIHSIYYGFAKWSRLPPPTAGTEAQGPQGPARIGQDQPRSHIRPPRLDLPKFSGKLEEWSAFYGVYKVAVHDKFETGVEKFTVLKTLLTGEALSLVNTLDITEANYKVAWDLICERYKSEKRFIYHHMGGLLDLPEAKSSNCIPPLLTKLHEHIHALGALNVAQKTYETLLVTVITRKLSPFLRRKLDESRPETCKKYPALAEMIKFLTAECSQVLDNPSASMPKNNGGQKGPKVLLSGAERTQSPSNGRQNANTRAHANRKSAKRRPNANNASTNSPNQVMPARAEVATASASSGSQKSANYCFFCTKDHRVYKCSLLLSLTPAERREAIRLKKLCENCISPHELNACKSKSNCYRCNQRHHTLLCDDTSTPLYEDRRPATQPTGPKAMVSRAEAPSTTMVLPSAKVLLTANGHQIIARALLDTCADVSIITVHCAQRLHLRIAPYPTTVQGLSECEVKVRGETKVNLCTTDSKSVAKNHRVLVAKSIAGLVPSVSISQEVRERCKSLELADPEFYRPQVVDVLIGVDLIGRVLSGPVISLGEEAPIAMNTVFGYVLLGSAPSDSWSSQQQSAQPRMLLTQTQPNLTELVERFWALEEVATASKETPEDAYVENLYATTTTQQENGRYCVRLPFRPEHPPLGTSLARAETRYKSLERRFERDPKFHAAYQNFMQDYEDKKFMSPSPLPPVTEQHYFLPHHGVAKPASSSTKLRVVFDASAPTSNGVSLNDILYPGPKLHSDIRTLLINFRKHAYVFTADIKGMFLHIDLHEDHRPYQMILWRHDHRSPIQPYTLNTVTFGVTCSPFLSNRTIKQLAYDYGDRYPRATRILLNNVYVDDILSGNTTLEQTREDRIKLEQLLAIGGFYLHKWTTSHPEVLAGLPAEALECPALEDPENPRYCLLGSHWVSNRDHFTYVIKSTQQPATKRGVLSLTASIYDPCGWVAPVVLTAKALIQQLWRLELGWDDPLPDSAQAQWDDFIAGLPELQKVTIPRLLVRPAPSYQLHGFADASFTGYGAVLYLRSSARSPGEKAQVMLVIARTRVAPKKELTLPKLELSAATLLAKMIATYLPLFKDFAIDKVVAWSDSTITLTWIQTPTYRLETFVANRVAQIQELDSTVNWMHVPSASNPSDVASRGISPRDLPDHPLWWHGPEWLALPESEWPPQPALLSESNLPGLKASATALVTSLKPVGPVIPSYSTWNKTLRVVATAHRYYAQIFLRITLTGPFRPAELVKAEDWIIHAIQHFYFEEDYRLLSQEKPTSTKRLKHLHPFIGEDGLIRVGGRLSHAIISEEAKHPAVLPGNDHVTRLLIMHFHRENLHPGPQLLQALLAQKYWILAGRRICRHVVHQCLQCFRAKPRQTIPLMGDLPAPRVQPNPIFLHAGVDFPGPFKLKVHQLRSARVVQVYLAIFVCLSVKAVHLEVVHDLTTPGFLAALHRFASHRGSPSDVYCDCGSNFIGASNLLKKILKEDDPDVLHYAYEHSLRFHFNPPAAPHAGGLWESAVKSAKSHMYRTIGLTVLILEEFQTLCQRIEAMLNSRPLTAASADPSDLTALTPGHFIIGRPLVAPPEQRFPLDNVANLQRWQRVHAMFQHIWHRWNLEYIHTLQPRKKWTDEVSPLTVDTLVLIHEPNTPPLAWRLGRITEVFPGADGHTRVATVKTATGELKRPVHKLYPLPTSDSC